MRLITCIVLVLSGCTMTRSLKEMPQGLRDVAALKPSMEQVAALDPTLKAVAELDASLQNVAELKAPFVSLGPIATITRPATYVPMFGCLGIVLFLSIWGGIKMGRR